MLWDFWTTYLTAGPISSSLPGEMKRGSGTIRLKARKRERSTCDITAPSIWKPYSFLSLNDFTSSPHIWLEQGPYGKHFRSRVLPPMQRWLWMGFERHQGESWDFMSLCWIKTKHREQYKFVLLLKSVHTQIYRNKCKYVYKCTYVYIYPFIIIYIYIHMYCIHILLFPNSVRWKDLEAVTQVHLAHTALDVDV